jgi:hypothetical protein
MLHTNLFNQPGGGIREYGRMVAQNVVELGRWWNERLCTDRVQVAQIVTSFCRKMVLNQYQKIL